MSSSLKQQCCSSAVQSLFGPDSPGQNKVGRGERCWERPFPPCIPFQGFLSFQVLWFLGNSNNYGGINNLRSRRHAISMTSPNFSFAQVWREGSSKPLASLQPNSRLACTLLIPKQHEGRARAILLVSLLYFEVGKNHFSPAESPNMQKGILQ